VGGAAEFPVGKENDGTSEAGEVEEEKYYTGDDDVDEGEDTRGPRNLVQGGTRRVEVDAALRASKSPRRFSSKYTVAFRAESVAYFQLFGSGNVSKVRTGEANALCSSVVNLKEVAKVLAGIGRELESIEALIPSTATDKLSGT
jgi:CO/xanthine dehydrogenase FAD-binding subunit